ncbi:MAG: AEC family transporter [Clostridia bacterium]|nr:AEC family transporter [Clostridia bacterium]
MTDILVRAGCFAAIILLGAILRRVGYFKREDFHLLSRVVINITLPAAIITNLSGREMEYTLLMVILVGFLYGLVLMLTAHVLNRRKTNDQRAFAIINTAGVNISNFVLPFAQGFLGPAGVMAVSLFDVGNAPICLGISYGIAETVKGTQKHFSLRPILAKLVRSIPLMTYIGMTLLSFLRIGLPGPVVSLAGIIGSANTFLAMLMIGVGFHITMDRLPEVFRILLPRLVAAILLAALCYFTIPVLPEYRKALIIPFLGPIGSTAPAYTARIDGDYELASAINSFSILSSLILIIGALIIIQ